MSEHDVEGLAGRLALLRCQDVHGLDYGYAVACRACESWGKYAAERLSPHIAARDAATRADAWDEAVQALAWAQDNGPYEGALRYVAEHNPYREAAASPTRGNGAGGETT
jgi:hypothetical protein